MDRPGRWHEGDRRRLPGANLGNRLRGRAERGRNAAGGQRLAEPGKSRYVRDYRRADRPTRPPDGWKPGQRGHDQPKRAERHAGDPGVHRRLRSKPRRSVGAIQPELRADVSGLRLPRQVVPIGPRIRGTWRTPSIAFSTGRRCTATPRKASWIVLWWRRGSSTWERTTERPSCH